MQQLAQGRPDQGPPDEGRPDQGGPDQGFRHVGLLYAGEDEFVAGAAAFVREGVAAAEPTLVVVSGAKIDRLHQALGPDAGAVQFADMDQVGGNPARIIPLWRQFLDASADGRPVRGIGEPVTATRTPAELVECQHHESLLNLAFDDERPFLLMCPYDTASLPGAVIDEARRSHPYVGAGGMLEPSTAYRFVDEPLNQVDHPLPPPAGTPSELPLRPGSLTGLRRFVANRARSEGLGEERVDDLVLCANEVASNSLMYGGASGVVRLWCEGGTLICEIHDRGHMRQPLAGRQLPDVEEEGRRGLWLVNQLCDLAQFRSSAEGTTVRLHLACP